MAKIPMSEFKERLDVAKEMLMNAYPDNAAVYDMCEAIDIAGQVVFHMSVPFQQIVEDKIEFDIVK